MRLIGSRRPAPAVGFLEAVARNLPGEAAGGGLFVPAELVPWADVGELLALAWPERCVEILDRLLAPEVARRELAAMVAEAFDFPVPLVELAEVAPAGAGPPPAGGARPERRCRCRGRCRCYALELFHGPSLAFKDFGARFLAAVLARLPAAGIRTVLTATSGDTGAAVAAAFWRRPGCRVVVLYPAGRIAPLQERQLACLGENVEALAVGGSFDDCQRLVKACFADSALAADLALTAANSINVARLVAQVLYYFEALAQLARREPGGAPPVVAVPSGNFGNLCAGLYARALGLPIGALVAATNANRTVPDHLDGGPYAPRPSVPTLSNAMDVGDPSNWERIDHLFRGDRDAMRRVLRWGSLDEPATAAALRRLWGAGYRADPHGAVAWGVMERVLRPGETGIFLATAHPAKFQSALAGLGLAAELPPALSGLLDRPLKRETLPADERAVKERLRRAGLPG